MGSAALLDSEDPLASAGKKKSEKNNGKKASVTGQKKTKRSISESNGEPAASRSRKLPRRAAACSNFKEKSVRVSEKSWIVETRTDQLVEEETVAVHLTAGQDEGRPNRRLTDFIFHGSDGLPQPLEMLEIDDVFVTGLVLPLDENSGKEKEKGIRCEGFGRMESWDISGYEDGSPVIWISTDVADYECLRPASGYKKFYDHFFEKARVCVEVYKRLSKSIGGNSDVSLDELLAGVVRSMSGSKSFSGGLSIKDFVVSQGEFIYNQLIGLDETSMKSDQMFVELPVLIALRDESRIHTDYLQANTAPSGGSLTIGSSTKGGGNEMSQSGSSSCVGEEDENAKVARLLQEEEYWQSMKQRRNQCSASTSNKFYIKINEDEIANDYPLPAYYKTSNNETDEFVIFDNDITVCDTDQLPRSMLHDWSLYNSDSRLISLELLPMKPCADIDVTIFGSGIMTADDGSGFCLDGDPCNTSSGSGAQDVDGIPIYLSAIKEWMIEFGSSMIFISIRTDMAWYRLGKPSKQYAPWYEPVLKTARLAISIITLLKEQSRVSRLSFADVIKRVSEFGKDLPAYISSNPESVERYVIVHGQIILQQFAEFPDEKIKKCAFVLGLASKMEQRHHTKWLVKKKKLVQTNEVNLNPRAAIAPVVSKRKVMQATTTRLINRIWGDYYSNYVPEDSKEGPSCDVKEEEEVDEQEENEEDDIEEEKSAIVETTPKQCSISKRSKSCTTSDEVRWKGKSVGKTCSGEALYKQAVLHGDMVAVGDAVVVEVDKSVELPAIYYVEFMFETSEGNKMFHGRKMQHGFHTVLGNAGSEREVFLTHECMEFELEDVKQKVVVEIRSIPWGHQHRKENAVAEKVDRVRAEERKRKGLPVEYYCKSVYWPERGAFFSIPYNTMGLGSGLCHSCKVKDAQSENENFRVTKSKTSFVYRGTEYSVLDFVYVSPCHFSFEKVENEIFKGGRNVGLKAYVICQLLEIIVSESSEQSEIHSTKVKVRRFFRPEDVSVEKAYSSDIREVYYSEETQFLTADTIEGKCEVRKKHDLPLFNAPTIFEHIFFCEHLYDPSKGSLKQLPAHIKLRYSTRKVIDDVSSSRKKKGKCVEGENDSQDKAKENRDVPQENCLATLDIFSGCGGLSEGLQQSGVSLTKWAIEYEEPAGEAFRLNHPGSSVFIKNCNVILRAVMDKCGDADDCISTSEAAELVASLSEKEIDSLPLPGQVDFINGGPPCQGFSGMNRFSQSTWSKVQCEMILAFLSFADYFRPKYFLLENVRNFVSFNKGQTFRLTLASLLEMGYQASAQHHRKVRSPLSLSVALSTLKLVVSSSDGGKTYMRKMKLPGGTHSSASTDPRLHRRTSRKPGFAGAGINLRKLGTPASKSGAVATPLLKWKFHDRVCVPVAGGGEPAAGRRGSRRVRGVDEGSVSVRKLGAGLWQLRQVAQVGGGGVRGRGVQCGRSDHLGFKLESTLSYPKSAMEGATKWDPGCQKTSDEVNNFYDRMRIFEDQHSTTASVVSVLQAELVKARARIHELEAEQRSSKNKFEHFLRKLSKERTSWQRREHQKIRMFVDDLKDGLNRERKNCQRMEIINAKLVNELGDAKLSAKQFLQNYEKERKARELLEEVCNELAKEIAEDKAEVEALKRESMKIHEEVEEERKMLQMAEVWREERVQMKLVDAKLTLEHKYSQMNKIIEDIQVFLESRSVASDAMELRKAELIQQAASSVNIQDSDFSYVVPQTYDIFSIIKELQNSEANEREIEPYADYNTTHHAAKIHNVSPDVNGLKGSPLLKHSMGFIVHDGGLEEDASGWDTASHAEDGASVYSVEGIDPSVNGKNFSGGGTEWDENARQDSLTTEVSEVCSVSAKESSQKASLVSKIWRSGLGNGEIYKIISVEANGRLSNGTISNVETISPTERDFGKGGISPHNSLMQCGSPGLGNSHINQGLKGSIEWKQGVQKNSLKAKLLEARMGSGKIQLCHVLKQKS